MISTLPNLALLTAGVSIFYVLAVIVYRLTLHPLAKYPGPFLAKITSWYDGYHGFAQDRAFDQYRCQQKYGNVFRYGPNHLCIQTAGGLNEIYHNAKTNNVRKADQLLLFHDHGACSTHTAIDKNQHAFKRRVMGHAFSESALRSLEPMMIDTIDKWLATLTVGTSKESKGWSSSVNMANSINNLSLDVLGDLCFGRPFGLLENEEHRSFPDTIRNRAGLIQTWGLTPLRPYYKWMQDHTNFEKYCLPAVYESMTEFRKFAIGALKAREELKADLEKNGGEQRKDFYHYLEQARDPVTGEGYQAPEMLAELRLLIGAGSDTSAHAMAAAFFYLVRNPTIMARLQEELRSTFTDVSQIVTGTELSSCHYLRAVIEESLRISPPVPSSLMRTVMNGGLTVDGITLAPGTDVSVATLAIHRSPEYFVDPEVFRPERWLTKYTPKEEVDRAKSVFVPFSAGNRGCIGKPMAYNEISIALGRVFWMYNVRLTAGDTTGQRKDGHYEMKDMFAVSRDGPMVEFRLHDTAREHAPLMRNGSSILDLDDWNA